MSPVTMMSLPDEPQEMVFKSVGRVMDHTEVGVFQSIPFISLKITQESNFIVNLLRSKL